MPDLSFIPAVADSLSMNAGPPLSGLFSLSAEAIVNIVATVASAGTILWKLAKRDQQFETVSERVGEIEDGYLPRAEFRMYCDAQQDAIKSLVSNFNSRMDTLDKHIQDVYQQNRPYPHPLLPPLGDEHHHEQAAKSK